VVSVYFLDSSALVKRYVAETGSAWIRGLTDPSARNPLIIARIAWVEVLGALARRQREGSLTPDDVTQAIRAFRYDLNMQYQVSEMGPALAEAAGDLVVLHPLRAYDAVQLASALLAQSDLARVEAPALTFLTADDRLLVIAEAEGLRTDNPNRHP
jgi:predicted nucleic acid-binding protein